jgi:hypothetical protein
VQRLKRAAAQADDVDERLAAPQLRSLNHLL